jgi:hypothetical protein
LSHVNNHINFWAQLKLSSSDGVTMGGVNIGNWIFSCLETRNCT